MRLAKGFIAGVEKSRGLRTVASAQTFLFARRGIVDVEHATLCPSVESESIFHGSNFLVQACQTRSSRRCISYTKRTANCVSASRARVVSEFYQVSPSHIFAGTLLALWVCEICNSLSKRSLELEARVGIEPTNAAFAEPCLTTWLPRHPFFQTNDNPRHAQAKQFF